MHLGWLNSKQDLHTSIPCGLCKLYSKVWIPITSHQDIAVLVLTLSLGYLMPNFNRVYVLSSPLDYMLHKDKNYVYLIQCSSPEPRIVPRTQYTK